MQARDTSQYGGSRMDSMDRQVSSHVRKYRFKNMGQFKLKKLHRKMSRLRNECTNAKGLWIHTVLETRTKREKRRYRMTGALWRTLLNGNKIWVLIKRTRTSRRDQDRSSSLPRALWTWELQRRQDIERLF